jgi:hypothetical protein
MVYFVNASAKTWTVNAIKSRAHLLMQSKVIYITCKYIFSSVMDLEIKFRIKTAIND